MRTQPVAFSALLIALVLFIGAGVFYCQQQHLMGKLDIEWRTLNQRAKGQASPKDLVGDGRVDLPVFDNTILVRSLNDIAEASKVSLDEVSFSLDENNSQPYLRYHATLSVSSNYATVRKFLDQLRASQPQMSLDSIACSRDDITTVELSCDIALSAFYRKDTHG